MAATTTLDYDDLPALLTELTGDEKHDCSALSTLDVLWVLYDRVLRLDPRAADDPDRDRFLLSKGHGPAAYYAVLAAKGFVDVDRLAGFGTFDSPLGYHPDHLLIPGVEISSGSLGHGLPIAVGTTLGLQARGRSRPRVFCLVGDAELDEGSNWEAVALAGRLGLASLTAVVVDNHSSTYHWPGGIDARFELEGWSAARVDGRDHDALERAFATPGGRPHVVVAEGARGAAPAATTTRSSARSPPGEGDRRWSWGRWRDDHHAKAFLRARDAAPRPGPPRRARAGRDRRVRAAPPRPRVQRRHPRAADDRRRLGPGARGPAAGRALLCALPGRAALRAGQARPRPQRRRRGPGQHRRLLRRRALGAHAPVAGRRGAAVRAAGVDDPRARPSRRARARA